MIIPVVLRDRNMVLLNFDTKLFQQALHINSPRYIARALPQGHVTEPYPKKNQ